MGLQKQDINYLWHFLTMERERAKARELLTHVLTDERWQWPFLPWQLMDISWSARKLAWRASDQLEREGGGRMRKRNWRPVPQSAERRPLQVCPPPIQPPAPTKTARGVHLENIWKMCSKRCASSSCLPIDTSLIRSLYYMNFADGDGSWYWYCHIIFNVSLSIIKYHCVPTILNTSKILDCKRRFNECKCEAFLIL